MSGWGGTMEQCAEVWEEERQSLGMGQDPVLHILQDDRMCGGVGRKAAKCGGGAALCLAPPVGETDVWRRTAKRGNKAKHCLAPPAGQRDVWRCEREGVKCW